MGGFVRGYAISARKVADLLASTGKPKPTADETLGCFRHLVAREAYSRIEYGYPMGTDREEDMVHIVVIDEDYNLGELKKRPLPPLHPDLLWIMGILDGPSIFDVIV